MPVITDVIQPVIRHPIRFSNRTLTFDKLSLLDIPGVQGNLAAWYDPSDPDNNLTEVGGLVSSLHDLSGNGNHATQGTGSDQPLTGAVTIGGLNALQYDGAGDGFDFTTDITDANFNLIYILETSDTNFIACCRKNSATTTHIAQDGNGTGPSLGFGTPTLRVNGTLETVATRDDVHTVLSTGSSVLVHEAGDTSAWSSMGMFNYDPSVFSLDGNVGEIIIMTGAIPEATRQQIETYLAWKWSGAL